MPTAERLVERFRNTGTIPHVAIQLTGLISAPNTNLKQFEELIRLDPTLVLRVLRMVNSAYYGFSKKIDSISRALVFIGMRNLRNMIATEALKDIFRNSEENSAFSRNRLWLHCAAVSICGQMISEQIFGRSGEDAFLAGILHDIGLIVEDQVVHDDLMSVCRTMQEKRTEVTTCEQRIMGTDHCEVGYLLAREWKLPGDVQVAIQRHHRNMAEIDPSSIEGIIQMAEFFATKTDRAGVDGMLPALSPPLVAHVKSRLGEYKALVRKLPQELKKAEAIYQLNEE